MENDLTYVFCLFCALLARTMFAPTELNIIIMDEPTSYLDVKYKLEFLSVLQELRHKKKLTVIMSLHELELADYARAAGKIVEMI